MRVRKARSAPEGAPDWVVTFGDMMSLLLCFFVLLWMISAATTEEEKARMIEGFQQGLLPSSSQATNFDPDRKANFKSYKKNNFISNKDTNPISHTICRHNLDHRSE